MTSLDSIDVNNQFTELPPTKLDYYRSVQLAANVMYVNNVPFLTSISNHMHCGTPNAVDNMKAQVLEVRLMNIIKSYAIRGFSVGEIFPCIQFKCVKYMNNLLVITRTFYRGEHVNHIEHYHRVIEERELCYYEMLPFNSLPRMMMVHLMITVLFHINAFVWMNGFSKVLSPFAIVEDTVLDYNFHFRVMFGEFV